MFHFFFLEIKYCLQFGYFIRGQYTELIVIQKNTSNGSETLLWTFESPDILGTHGWKEFKLSFFGNPQANLHGKGVCNIGVILTKN